MRVCRGDTPPDNTRGCPSLSGDFVTLQLYRWVKKPEVINHHLRQLQNQLRQRKQQEAKQMVDRIRNQQEKLNELRNETFRELHLDSDGDGITDIEERIKGTSPYSIDTDWDGHTDLEEVNSGTNPRINNTDKQHSPPASDYKDTELEL